MHKAVAGTAPEHGAGSKELPARVFDADLPPREMYAIDLLSVTVRASGYAATRGVYCTDVAAAGSSPMFCTMMVR